MSSFADQLKAFCTESARRQGARIPERAIDQAAMRAVHEDEHGVFAEGREAAVLGAEIEGRVLDEVGE
jgi:hypothetical protein